MVHGSDIITDNGVMTDDQASILQSQVSDNKYANVISEEHQQIYQSLDHLTELINCYHTSEGYSPRY
jgi:hypothetical protein